MDPLEEQPQKRDVFEETVMHQYQVNRIIVGHASSLSHPYVPGTRR